MGVQVETLSWMRAAEQMLASIEGLSRRRYDVTATIIAHFILKVRRDEAPLLRCEATTSWKRLFKPECVKSIWWEWIHGQPLHPIYTFTSNNLWLSL